MRFIDSLPIALIATFLAPAITRAGDIIFGFTPEAAWAQRKWEEVFLAVPRPDSASKHLRMLTEDAHVAGTPEDYATGLYVRDTVRRYGLESELRGVPVGDRY